MEALVGTVSLFGLAAVGVVAACVLHKPFFALVDRILGMENAFLRAVFAYGLVFGLPAFLLHITGN